MSKAKSPIAAPVVATTNDAAPSAALAALPVAADKAAPKASSAARKPAAKSVEPKAATVKAATAKAAKAVAPKTKAEPAKAAAKPEKPASTKLVRDSFTFPKSEYDVLVAMKKRLLTAGVEVKKGELMRAGLALLNGLDDAALTAALGNVQKLKTGRPAK